MPSWVEQLLPIALLLAVIAVVIARLPRVDLDYDPRYRARRVRNWLPVGLLYSFFYMGRYNLTVAKRVFGDMLGPDGQSLMTNADFGTIFGVGATVYGCAFLVNGPITDRIGGKKALLIGGLGTAVANFAMGWVTMTRQTGNLTLVFAVLYGVNMYFQSFGAVGIVKVNAPWFHVRERGVFGAIFGILISLGIYFAFDVGGMITGAMELEWVFFIPSVVIGLTWLAVLLLTVDRPAQAGFDDFDTGDASSGEEHLPPDPVVAVFKRLLTNPIVMTIALIEFCSGFLRQAIMQWYQIYAKALGETDSFVFQNWGMLLCCAGIMGGVFAGVISDRVFGSRRGPVAAVLYGAMLVSAIVLSFVLGSPLLGPIIIFMSLCVIGVHGMLSGTASMDFGGRRNAGIAVGIIDGFVYLGTGVMSFTYGQLLPDKGAGTSGADDWIAWPVAMIPVALIGFVLARRVWNARPKGGAQESK
ncbi:MAG: MFS transporter [Deltaproteobacteria bacterium]|nr:MFS transporter [Deltaproteobacteria bacterium]